MAIHHAGGKRCPLCKPRPEKLQPFVALLAQLESMQPPNVVLQQITLLGQFAQAAREALAARDSEASERSATKSEPGERLPCRPSCASYQPDPARGGLAPLPCDCLQNMPVAESPATSERSDAQVSEDNARAAFDAALTQEFEREDGDGGWTWRPTPWQAFLEGWNRRAQPQAPVAPQAGQQDAGVEVTQKMIDVAMDLDGMLLPEYAATIYRAMYAVAHKAKPC